MFNLYNRVFELCQEKSISVGKMCNELKISRGNLTDLKKERIKTLSSNNLEKIAAYFNVSVDYLLGKTDIKKPLPRNIYPIEEGDFIVMPVLASVKAGYDGQAIIEYTDETIPVAKIAYKGYPKDECSVLRVSGNSMYPKLLDGDYILVHRQTSVDSGSVAVVIYNGDEATVKKVRYKSGEDWVELIPVNPEYQTKRIVGIDLEECHVFGLVLGLVYRDI